jgi:hypothetical protein
MSQPATTDPQRIDRPPPEIAISRWWQSAPFKDPLKTTAGISMQVVFRGVWSHGLGPDFAGAMIAMENGVLLSGSVEIHRHASDWHNHGHDRDPAYNDVILHAVLEDDGVPTRRADGKLVPVVVLAVQDDELRQADWDNARWSAVGGDVCAEHLATTQPVVIRNAIWELGDRRLAGKTARIEARLSNEEPATILYRELLDGLGYSANREPMRHLAAMAPAGVLTALQSTVEEEHRDLLMVSVLMGASGFLPLSPQLADAASLSMDDQATIERYWKHHGGPWHGAQIAPSSWNVTRVRPANHPARRIATAALLMARTPGGIVFEVTEAIRSGANLDELLVGKSEWNGINLLGRGRATEIVTNSLVPFALALAEHTGDTGLAESASSYWERLAGGEQNAVTRRALKQVAGSARLTGLGARGLQGLIHLDTTLCAPRRCFECPVAHLVTQETAPIVEQ